MGNIRSDMVKRRGSALSRSILRFLIYSGLLASGLAASHQVSHSHSRLDFAPSPIWHKIVTPSEVNVDTINEWVIHNAYNERAGIPMDIRSTRKGWRVNLNDTLAEMPQFQGIYAKIREFYAAALEELGFERPTAIASGAIVKGWANILGKDGENVRHNHPNCHMSAVFYTSTPKGSGVLRIYAPHRFPRSMDNIHSEMVKQHVPLTRGSALSSSIIEVQITKGLIVMFPSYLEHRVLTNMAHSSPRISLAFNIMPRLPTDDKQKTNEYVQDVEIMQDSNGILVPSKWTRLDFRSWAVGSTEIDEL